MRDLTTLKNEYNKRSINYENNQTYGLYVNSIGKRGIINMNLNSDIVRYAIPHQCKQCTHCNDCNHFCYNTPNPRCWSFIPNNMNSFLNDAIVYFSLNVPKSKEAKLKRVCTYHGAYNDRVTTLDDYYVNFINDCIRALRKGKTVYIFKLSHLWEIAKFHTDMVAAYVGDGIISLTGNCQSKGKINNLVLKERHYENNNHT